MDQLLSLFREITARYTDREWGKSRDDLISRAMKALRAFKEGKGIEDVRSNREISLGIEDILETLHKFTTENPHMVEKLLKVLSIYVKSPSPCKTRLISMTEVLLEDIRLVKN